MSHCWGYSLVAPASCRLTAARAEKLAIGGKAASVAPASCRLLAARAEELAFWAAIPLASDEPASCRRCEGSAATQGQACPQEQRLAGRMPRSLPRVNRGHGGATTRRCLPNT